MYASHGIQLVRAFDGKTLRPVSPRVALGKVTPPAWVLPWARSPDGWSLAAVTRQFSGVSLIDLRSGRIRGAVDLCCIGLLAWPARDRLVAAQGEVVEAIDPRRPAVVHADAVFAPPGWNFGTAVERGESVFLGYSPGRPLAVIAADGFGAPRQIRLRRLWGGGPYTRDGAGDALRRAIADLRKRTGISPTDAQVVSVTWESWPTLFGCTGATIFDVGYRVVLEAHGEVYDYRVHVPNQPGMLSLLLRPQVSPPPDPDANFLTAGENAAFPGDPGVAFDPGGWVYVLGKGAPVAGIDLRTDEVHYWSALRVPDLIGLRVAWVDGSRVVLGTSRLRLADVRTGWQRRLDRRLDFVVARRRVLTFGGFRGVPVYGPDGTRRFVLLRRRYVDRGASQGRYAYFRLYQTRRWCVADVAARRVIACARLPAGSSLLTGRSGVRTSEQP
jgi:hypothetical protein